MAGPGECSCCGGSNPCGKLCVNTIGCTNAPLPGTFVSLIQGGVTVASGVSSGQVTGLTPGLTGSGYVPGSPPTVAITGGGGFGAAATPIMSADGHSVTGYTVTSPGSHYTSRPDVTVSPPPSGTTATATATYAAQVCLDFSTPGPSTVTVTYVPGGYATKSTPVTLACKNTTISVTLVPDSDHLCPGSLNCVNTCPPASVLPKTLYVSDGMGVIAVTNPNVDSIFSTWGWAGCAIRPTNNGLASCVGLDTSGTVAIHFGILCEPTARTFTVAASGVACGRTITNGGGTGHAPRIGADCSYNDGTFYGGASGDFVSPSCEAPSGSVTVDLTNNPYMFAIYGPSVTLSVSP